MKRITACRIVIMLLIFCMMPVGAAHLERHDISVVEAKSKKAVYRVKVNTMKVRAGKVTINGAWRKGATQKAAASKKAKKLGNGTKTFLLRKDCKYKMFDSDTGSYNVSWKSYVNEVSALKMTVYVYVTKTGRVRKIAYRP